MQVRWKRAGLAESHQHLADTVPVFQVIIADVGDKDSSYNDFLSVLPPSDCRYGGMAFTALFILAFAAYNTSSSSCVCLFGHDMLLTLQCDVQYTTTNSQTVKALYSTR